MLTKLFKHISSLTIVLRCFQDILSRLNMNELLYLAIVLLNSLVEKKAYTITSLDRISFSILGLTYQFCAELNDWWSACYRSSSSKHGCLLYHKASIAGSFCFLTQFMSFQDIWFFKATSWILSLKNNYFVFLTVFLNTFQLSICLDILYFASFD